MRARQRRYLLAYASYHIQPRLATLWDALLTAVAWEVDCEFAHFLYIMDMRLGGAIKGGCNQHRWLQLFMQLAGKAVSAKSWLSSIN